MKHEPSLVPEMTENAPSAISRSVVNQAWALIARVLVAARRVRVQVVFRTGWR
jgi:hypothetical protein